MSTRFPLCASEMAMFAVTVVLPSRGLALVMTIARMGSSALMNVRFVRMARQHSAAALIGCVCTNRSRVSA